MRCDNIDRSLDAAIKNSMKENPEWYANRAKISSLLKTEIKTDFSNYYHQDLKDQEEEEDRQLIREQRFSK